MKMRYEDPDNIILKDVLPPEEDYDFHVESQTLEDLSNLENSDKLILESLVAAERILGKYNIHTGNLAITGEQMAKRNKYLTCRKLCNRAITIKIYNNENITLLLHRHCSLVFIYDKRQYATRVGMDGKYIICLCGRIKAQLYQIETKSACEFKKILYYELVM